MTGHVRVIDDAPPGSDCCRDPRFSLIGGHTDVDVDAASTRLWRVKLVEPQMRIPPTRVDRILFAEIPVTASGGPERSHIGAGILGDGYAYDLYLRRVGHEPELPRHYRYAPGKLGVELAQGTVFS